MERLPYSDSSLKVDGRNQIRVVHLEKGQFENPIHATLEVRPLLPLSITPASPNYEAVSYVWGQNLDVRKIFLNGHIVLITANLEAALRHIRLEDKPRILWVDAICINQSDVNERN